jgi:dihydropteroate synthase
VKLIEPLGLLHGPAADTAMAAGLACQLAGGPAAFALVRLIDSDTAGGTIVRVADVPDDFRAALATVSSAPPPWGGLSGPQPWLMGVLNATPDSFSDGGLHTDPIAAGLALAAAGADVVDIGGESTRPRSAAVTPAEEQDRILPAVTALARSGVAVSIDTRNAATMRAAIGAGARIINDVSALRHDPEAAGVVAAAGCDVVLMHMRGSPADMHLHAEYADVAVEVTLELAAAIDEAVAAGIDRSRIAVDPGIGFAKRGEHNLALLPRLGLLRNLGCAIVLGVSRKRFIGTLADTPEPRQRSPGSIAAALAGLPHAEILRVHDVAQTLQAVRVWRGIHSMGYLSLLPPA